MLAIITVQTCIIFFVDPGETVFIPALIILFFLQVYKYFVHPCIWGDTHCHTVTVSRRLS